MDTIPEFEMNYEDKKRNQQRIIEICRNGNAIPGKHCFGNIYWTKRR